MFKDYIVSVIVGSYWKFWPVDDQAFKFWTMDKHKYISSMQKCIFSSTKFFGDSCVSSLTFLLYRLWRFCFFKYFIIERVLVGLASKNNYSSSNNDPSKMTWIKK